MVIPVTSVQRNPFPRNNACRYDESGLDLKRDFVVVFEIILLLKIRHPDGVGKVITYTSVEHLTVSFCLESLQA